MSASAIPNVLSASRLVLTPTIIFLILRNAYAAAFVLLLIAGITDGLDGYLARRFHGFSRLGAYLDSIGDKVLVVGVVVALAWQGDLPVWLVALVLGRDVLILAGSAAIMTFTALRDFPPSPWGKVATAINLLTAGTVLVARATGVPWIGQLAAGMIWVAGAGVIWSGCHYAWISIRRLRAVSN